MNKFLIGTLLLISSFQARAGVLVEPEEILAVKECSAPQTVQNLDGTLKTEIKLSYVGCTYLDDKNDWQYVHRNADISLPGNNPRIEKDVVQLCESLKGSLSKQVVHVEDSLCMKE